MRYARPLILSLLTLSFLAGCGTHTGTTWRHETVSGKAKAAARVAAKATPKPAASTPATTPTPDAAKTFSFVATMKGAALAGYDVQVFDARNGQRFEAGATLKSADATTGANGGFKIQVSGIPAGQALRVVASKSGFAVEAVLTAGADAAKTVTLDETSTLLARASAGPLAATQVLLAAEAAPVVARVAEYELLRGAIAAELGGSKNLEANLNRPEDRAAQSKAVRLLLAEAGLNDEVSKFQAELLQATAKLAADAENRSDAAQDAEVLAGLKDLELVGTVLKATYADGKFSLENTVDHSRIDAATGALETVLKVVRR